MKRFNKVFKTFFVVAFVSSLLLATGCSSSKVASKSDGKQLVLDSAIKQGSLDNGINYFIRENGEPKNRIQLRLVVKAGSCMEDEDQKGVAHFVEHMCFNGTKNFEKSAIVDYFEKIGMKFGPEVNAYTSFEETVYMLELPADDPEILKTSLLVLHDWASAVSFVSEEIEKERGVIVEEWRMRTQGVSGRISDKLLPVLLNRSRYAERIPIGSMDVVKKISRDRIIDFYKKWYRPENMSVVAVGDIKSEVLENAIKEVMGEIPASEKETKVPSYEIPAKKNKTLDIVYDKELSIIQCEIYRTNTKREPITTVEQLRREYVLSFAGDVFNMRCQEITTKPDSPWLGAGIGRGSNTNNSEFYFMQFYPKTGMFTEAFKIFLDEYDRFMNFGVTESELNRLKNNYLLNVNQSFENKDKHPSPNYASNIVNHILTGRIYISEEDNFKICTDIINQITPEEILATAKECFEDRGDTMFVLCPESMEIPSDKEIKEIWNNYESEVGKQKYVDDAGDDILMQKPSKKAKISEKKEIKELGGTQYTFENGVKIITKKTDFQTNSIAIYAGSKGGLYQHKEEDVPSAEVAVEYAILSGVGNKTYSQMQKIATAKKLNVNYNISRTSESINATASKENIEETLQSINLRFSEPKFTADGWETLLGQYKQIAESYGARPSQVFNEKLRDVIYGKNLWHAPLNNDLVAKFNPETAERIYRERFGNPADFTFVFVGDFNEKQLVDLCAYYLGTLKTNINFEETKYVYFPFPKKNQTVTVRKGIDNTGDVYICFGGELPQCDDMEQSFRESTIINQLGSLLDIRLREVIREDKSGSYGVSAGGYIDGWPERFYQVYIDFGCEPAREEELSAEVIKTIKDIQKGNISDELVDKLKETYIRSVETSLRNNYWWLNRFSAEVLFTYEPLWITSNSNKAVEWITKEALVEAANKYLNTERVVTGYLKPEK